MPLMPVSAFKPIRVSWWMRFLRGEVFRGWAEWEIDETIRFWEGVTSRICSLDCYK